MFNDKFGLLPVAILESHFQGVHTNKTQESYLSVYDICDSLNQLWSQIRQRKISTELFVSQEFILDLTNEIAQALNGRPTKEFLSVDAWEDFIQEAYFPEDAIHARAWVFSHLYWSQLQYFKIATCWFHYNIYNISHALPEEWLRIEKMNLFLESLSNSGPPIYDGQTFYPSDYAK